MLALETTRSHTDALKQGKQHSHYFMLAAASAVQSNLCHKSTGCFHVESHLNGDFSHNEFSRRNVSMRDDKTRSLAPFAPLITDLDFRISPITTFEHIPGTGHEFSHSTLDELM